MDEAEYGVIIFAIGSLTKRNSMPAEMKSAFKEAFAQIPQRVVWKFEEPIEDISDNVLVVEWLPQRDVLGNFIVCQGGRQGNKSPQNTYQTQICTLRSS